MMKSKTIPTSPKKEPARASGKNTKTKNDASKLRKQAEKLTAKKPPVPAVDVQRLFAELQISQIELEMQNDESNLIQAELEASRAGYIELYNLAPMGYFVISEKGLILDANNAAANMLGVNRKKLIKQPLYRFISKEHTDTYYLCSQNIFETGESQASELRMVKKDGTLLWVHMQMNATLQADRDNLKCRVMLSDINDRKLAEQALWAVEEHLSLALFSSGMGWWDWNMVSDALYISTTYCELSGYTETNIQSGSAFFKSIIHPDDFPTVDEAMKNIPPHGGGGGRTKRL